MKRPRPAPVAILVLLGAPLAAAAASPQTALLEQRGARALEEDMAFARELAVRYQYMDLAEAVLSGLAKESLSEKQKENLALVQCQVFTEGAKREGDAKKRLEIFGKATAAFGEFFENHPYSELLPEAERSYLALINVYGKALEMALQDAVGEEAAGMRATIQKVLDEGLKRTGKVIESYSRPGLSAAEKVEKWRLMLDRAQMLITLGNVSADPTFLFKEAERLLTGVAEEAGETSGPGLNAFLALTKLNLLRAKYKDAQAFAEYVADVAVPRKYESEEWKELPLEVKAERFKLVELAIPDLLESLNAQGETTKACQWALYFFNAWKREGFTISPFGYLALLSSARTLLDAGGYVGGSMTAGNLRWFETEEEMSKAGFSARDSRSSLDLALKTAQDINTENKGNVLQVRAQKLISDVIGRPGVTVPPDVLLEAALGEYNTGNYQVAIGALKDVLRALDARDDAARREYMPKVLFYLGQSYYHLERPLEAAVAFRDGATRWSGDPEYQLKLAQGFYRDIGTVRKGANGDPLIQAEYLKAEQLVQQASEGGGSDTITWRQAERAYDKKEWDAARTSYLAVGEGADEHEKALVKAAMCLYRKGDKAGIQKELENYLERFVRDPKHAITGERKVVARKEARAQATYWLGKLAYEAEAYDDVVRVLAGYEKEFPDQTEYAPNALFMVVQAQLSRKNLDGARAALATLESTFPTGKATSSSAYQVYAALRSEQEAAEAAKDAARSEALQREMAHVIRLCNRAADEPSFGNLRVETALWIALSDWESAEESLRLTLRFFQKERADDVEKFVRPDLGEALLGQKRVKEAFEVLDPLVPKDEGDARKPSSSLVHDWCRAVTGWVENEAAEIVEVPGVGGDFKNATAYLDKLISAEKTASGGWTCPWYVLKFEHVYAYLQWSKTDSAQRATAKAILDDIVSQLGDADFKDVGSKCGDDLLRKRYLWLRTQLR